MLTTGHTRQETMEVIRLEELVPEDHLLRKIDRYIDFSFLHDLCAPYYSKDNGRPAIEPEILFKMLFRMGSAAKEDFWRKFGST